MQSPLRNRVTRDSTVSGQPVGRLAQAPLRSGNNHKVTFQPSHFTNAFTDMTEGSAPCPFLAQPSCPAPAPPETAGVASQPRSGDQRAQGWQSPWEGGGT